MSFRVKLDSVRLGCRQWRKTNSRITDASFPVIRHLCRDSLPSLEKILSRNFCPNFGILSKIKRSSWKLRWFVKVEISSVRNFLLIIYKQIAIVYAFYEPTENKNLLHLANIVTITLLYMICVFLHVTIFGKKFPIKRKYCKIFKKALKSSVFTNWIWIFHFATRFKKI